MKILDAGHKYLLESIYGTYNQTITFIKKFRGNNNHDGIVIQELLRAIIDRIIFLDKELPSPHNVDILYHLRMAFIHLEARALERKVFKKEIQPEQLAIGKDGHFLLTEK